MKKRKIGKGTMSLIVSVLLISALVITYTVIIANIENGFVKNPDYQEHSNEDKYKSFRKDLEAWGFDTVLAGISGGELTVVSTKDFKIYSYGIVWDRTIDRVIEKGTEISSDFVSWSSRPSSRRVMITIDGRTYETTMKTSDFARLYYNAIKQNGLEEQFKLETGKRLTMSSAKKEIRSIDRQLYENGVFMPGDYPFDTAFLENVFMIISIITPFLAIALVFIAGVMAERTRYNNWLIQYNGEHIEDWDKIAGTLPQFESYKASGIRDETRYVYKKRTFKEIISNMFKPGI